VKNIKTRRSLRTPPPLQFHHPPFSRRPSKLHATR
jgi:hypothetical protein